MTFNKLRSVYKYLLLGTILILFLLALSFLLHKSNTEQSENIAPETWQIRSIDTMKYSRDLTVEMSNNPLFDQEINTQVSNIAQTGATHIAIATPYDEQFVPFLEKWVREARRNNLKVWFRGNWSNWEGWFGYEKKMTFEEHIQKSVHFIKDHPELFEDGDSFTACPECENGVMGDPRQTGKVQEYRNFLIKETDETQKALRAINKKVSTNWLSMNGDVADLIMDKDTTQRIGGIVSIDHYVKTPQQLNADINRLAEKSGGKIFLGEFGVPIPDINGSLSEVEQAEWIDKSLELLSENPNVLGINYWTNMGGSTEIWNNNKPKKAVSVITRYYKPLVVLARVTDETGQALSGVAISKDHTALKNGQYEFFLTENSSNVTFSKDGYHRESINIAYQKNQEEKNINITLKPTAPSLWYRIKAIFFKNPL